MWSLHLNRTVRGYRDTDNKSTMWSITKTHQRHTDDTRMNRANATFELRTRDKYPEAYLYVPSICTHLLPEFSRCSYVDLVNMSPGGQNGAFTTFSSCDIWRSVSDGNVILCCSRNSLCVNIRPPYLVTQNQRHELQSDIACITWLILVRCHFLNVLLWLLDFQPDRIMTRFFLVQPNRARRTVFLICTLERKENESVTSIMYGMCEI
jgi:hypothetical protein